MITNEGKNAVRVITESVSEYFDLTKKDLLEKTKNSNVVIPRQFAHKLSKDLTKLSAKNIALMIGNKHHTTVFNSIKKVNNFISTDKKYAKMYRDVESICRAKLGINDLNDIEEHINNFRKNLKNPELINNFDEIINRLTIERDRQTVTGVFNEMINKLIDERDRRISKAEVIG